MGKLQRIQKERRVKQHKREKVQMMTNKMNLTVIITRRIAENNSKLMEKITIQILQIYTIQSKMHQQMAITATAAVVEKSAN